jgi:hypothetical protein
MRNKVFLITALLFMVILIMPTFAQGPPAEDNGLFPFAGVRYDNHAYLASIGALSEDVQLLPIPGLLDIDVGPLCSIWYMDVIYSARDRTPEKTSSIAFELAVKSSLITERLTGGFTLGPSFEQQDTEATVGDYFAASTGGFLSYNWAKSRERPWGPWAYARYKSGLEDGYVDGWQLGIGFFMRS